MYIFRYADTAEMTMAQLRRLAAHWKCDVPEDASRAELRKAIMNSPRNSAPDGPSAYDAHQALLPTVRGES